MKKTCLIILIIATLALSAMAQKIFIPMDLSQTNHLKAYGVVYSLLGDGMNIEWLLNYRGGSFLMPAEDIAANLCRLRGVKFETIDGAVAAQIYAEIEEENMEVVLLEKAPKIAIYTPHNTQPWDDAVTMALTYAEVPYDKIWDLSLIHI